MLFASMFGDFVLFLQTAMICLTILFIAFMIGLSLPKSELRTFVMRGCYAATAVVCVLYCTLPVDILPEAFLGPIGLADDLGVGIAGIVAGKRALFPAPSNN
jgi:hypothetical protein